MAKPVKNCEIQWQKSLFGWPTEHHLGLPALDKCPGVSPIGIGEAWMRLVAICVLQVSVLEAKAECGVDQLWAGLEAGIEGGIHCSFGSELLVKLKHLDNISRAR